MIDIKKEKNKHMTEEEIQELKNQIKELETNNKIIKQELETKTNEYKKLSMEVGQIIFQNEDYEYEIKKQKETIRQLNQKIEEIKKENENLKKFKKEIESSTTWKLKSKFK